MTSPSVAARLADGEWHRLHWASPLLKGGIALVFVIGFILNNLRERIVEMFVDTGPRPDGRTAGDYGDIVSLVYEHGQTGLAILIILGVLLLAVAAFALAWRMHSFRITGDAVEVRSGILFRRNRQARLDRVQDIHISRPVFARLFGAAKLELNVAGQDARVDLAYLGTRQVDELRREILHRASGVQQAKAAVRDAAAGVSSSSGVAPPTAAPRSLGDTSSRSQPAAPGGGVSATPGAAASAVPGDAATVVSGEASSVVPGEAPGVSPGLVNRRVSEFLAPELDPDAAPPASIVRITPGRLLGSLVLSEFTVILVLIIVALFLSVVVAHRSFLLFLLLPSVIGSFGYYSRRFTKSLRYSIAGTADGVRIGFGLLSTSNDTLPPGRIHAIEVSQPLLWRPAGWWMIRINRAGHASSRGGSSQPHTLLLPVGRVDDVERVLGLLLPGLAGVETQSLVIAGLTARSGAGFRDAPRRAFWLRPFSWRRTGYAETPDAVLLRTGFFWRRLTVVPLARLQSLHVSQGPVQRALDLTALHFNTIAGPVRASLGVIDRRLAEEAFGALSEGAVIAAGRDPSHRWAEARDAGLSEVSAGDAAEAGSR